MDQVKPLLVWSNLSGLYPLAQQRKYKVVLGLWCLVVFVLQASDLVMTVYRLYTSLHKTTDMTTLNMCAYVLDNVLILIIKFLPRLFCLRYRHFALCFQHLSKFDDIYVGSKFLPELKTRKIAAMGLAIGLIWLLIDIGFLVPYYEFVYSKDQSIKKYFAFTAEVFSYSHVVLVYYCLFVGVFFIGTRINGLAGQFKDIAELPPEGEAIFLKTAITDHMDRSSSSLRRRLETMKTLLNRIHWACDEIVHTFSHFILVMLTVKLITTSISVFRCVHWLFTVYSQEDSIYFKVALPVRDIVRSFALMFIIFYLADTLVLRMVNVKKVLADFSVSSMTWPEKMELKFLLMEIDLKRVQLSAGGIFGVGKHLLPGILGTIITYIVILLQSQRPQ